VKLISITLRNYRIHRDLTVEFDPSRTVIVGGNESGKSTLIEAAHHALFLRSKVTGEMAQSLTSQFHEGHPLVSLIFEVGGKRYTITKQFGGGTAASALLAEEGGATLRGDEAEEKVHRLCRAEEVSGGRGLIGRIRAQWAHLWVWQGSAGSDPVEAANQAQPRAKLCERLGQLEGGGVLASGLDNEVVQEVAERYRGIFKENGSPRSDSALAVTAAGLAQATVARAAAVVALAGLRSAVEEIDVSGKAIVSCTTSLGTMQAELAGVKEKMVAVGSLRILESQQKHAASSAEAVYRELKKADEEIVACEVLLVTRTEQMAPALVAAERAVDEERDCNTRFTEALAAAASASQAHAAVADILELVSLCEQVERLKVEQVGLGGRWADIRRLREEMRALRVQARECAVLTPADVTKLSGLEKARDQAAATLQAIATRIEVVAGARPVLLAGRELSAGDAETITSATEVVIGDVRLRILPGGGRSLEEAAHLLEDSTAHLRGRLSGLGLESVEEARGSLAMRQNLENQILAKEVAIKGLGGDLPGQELEALGDRIAALAAEIERRSPVEFARPADLTGAESLKTEMDTLRHQRWNAVASATAHVKAAKELLDGATQAKSAADDAVGTHREAIRSLETKQGLIVERFGADRSAGLREREQASREAGAAWEQTCRQLEAFQPEVLQQDVQRLERALAGLREQKQEAETKQQVAQGRLQLNGTVNPQGDLATADVQRRLAAASHGQMQQEAEAIRLLKQLFEDQQKAVATQFVEPLKRRVADYLQRLYGPGTELVVDFDGASFGDLRISRAALGNVPFSFAQLSGGGREQVAAAFRLAMAEILAEDHGGCLPVVFDDAFVNSDPDRIRELQRVLDLGAARGLQIIVLSCHPASYTALGAKVVPLSRPVGLGLDQA